MSLRAPGARVAAPTPTPELAAAAGLIPPIASPPAAPPPAPLPQISTLRSDQVAPVASPVGSNLCPRCGENSPDGSRFCHSCGFALSAAAPKPPPAAVAAAPIAAPPPSSSPVSVVCSRCRGVADPGADFCKFCGARLNAPVSSPRLAQAQAQPVPQAAPQVAPQPIAQPAEMPSAPPAMSAMPSTPAAVAPAVQPPRPAPAGEVVRARLVRIAKDGSEGAQHPISADVTDIGRTEGAIVLADDPYLSPRHARITLRPSESGAGPSIVLADLGSVNGVFVRLRAAHPLTHGDLLLLGQQVLRFEAVTELEGARGPAMQHGVLLFGSPAPVTRARLLQRTVEGLVRDVMYLVRDEFVIGREAGDRTYPEDVFMSRRHAAFKREGVGHSIHDLGSSNGTFLQIHGEHVLQDGDQFRIGHHLFRVDVADVRPGAA